MVCWPRRDGRGGLLSYCRVTDLQSGWREHEVTKQELWDFMRGPYAEATVQSWSESQAERNTMVPIDRALLTGVTESFYAHKFGLTWEPTYKPDRGVAIDFWTPDRLRVDVKGIPFDGSILVPFDVLTDRDAKGEANPDIYVGVQWRAHDDRAPSFAGWVTTEQVRASPINYFDHRPDTRPAHQCRDFRPMHEHWEEHYARPGKELMQDEVNWG